MRSESRQTESDNKHHTLQYCEISLVQVEVRGLLMIHGNDSSLVIVNMLFTNLQGYL